MAFDTSAGRAERRAAVIGGVSVALLAAAIASDFVVGSFWAKHAMLTSLVASLLVVVISVAVINEVIERRERRRWRLLAQGVLFALVQSARLTWTSMVEVLRLIDVETGSLESLLEAARIALVGAAPYAALLERHVELQGRLEWATSVLEHREPAPDGGRSRRLTRASIATEHADDFDDDWIHDMVVSITLLATRLDYDSRALAFSLVSEDWWNERTRALVET